MHFRYSRLLMRFMLQKVLFTFLNATFHCHFAFDTNLVAIILHHFCKVECAMFNVGWIYKIVFRELLFLKQSITLRALL